MTKNKKVYQYRADYINKAFSKSVTLNLFQGLKRSFAFSLVELLMALLVASLLLAALAPVMTKKFGENVNITGVVNNHLQETERIIKCSRTDEDIKLEDIAYSDNRVTFLLVSGGGGGGGASGAYKSPEISLSTPTSNTTSSSNKILNLNKDMVDFELETLIGGGGGGGGGSYSTTGNTNYCTNLGNGKTDTTGHTGTSSKPIFVYNEQSKLCVTAYGQLASGGCKIHSENGYSIPICSYAGAVSACNLLTSSVGKGKFSIPEIGQMSKWPSAFAISSPPNGIDEQNCGKTVGSICHLYGPAAPSDATTNTVNRVGAIWSSTSDNGSWAITNCSDGISKFVHHYHTRNGSPTFEGGANCPTSFKNGYVQYSNTRCVIKPFFSFSGGGGGGAPGIINKSGFNNEVKTLFKKAIEDNIKTGSIKIEAGTGGNKGSKGADSTNGGNGGDGSESCITVYTGVNATGNISFKVCAPGGNGGKGAVSSLNYSTSSSYYAAGGATKAINSCYYQNYNSGTGTKVQFNCSNEGALGEHGYGASNATETTWGHGGASALNLNTYAGTGSINGATLNSISYPGSGGSGGRAKLETNETYTIGEGGAGAGGLVKITYKTKKEGAAGGGGAGGSAVRISNVIFTKKYYDCKITVGKGGAGGSPGNTQNSGTAIKGSNGTNGGNSSITCDNGNTTYTVFGGNGGAGASAPTASLDSAPGTGGAAFDKNTAATGKMDGLKNSMIYMILGKKGETANENAIKTGGSGGTSGTGALGGCAGTISEENKDNCIASSSTSPDGKGFKVDDVSDAYQFYGSNLSTAWQNIVNGATPSFGTAGAGGGGGTYKDIDLIGKGGDGMPGYVCVFYTKGKN